MSDFSPVPERFPRHCPLCGGATNLESTDSAEDAPCPACGHGLRSSTQLLASLQRRLGEPAGGETQRFTPDMQLVDLAADSLDMIELVMELEKELNVAIPFHEAERLQTLGDVIRYADQRRRGS